MAEDEGEDDLEGEGDGADFDGDGEGDLDEDGDFEARNEAGSSDLKILVFEISNRDERIGFADTN